MDKHQLDKHQPNLKTTDDLFADTENTWEFKENLEELLFDCDTMLEEALSQNRTLPIRKGDIIMANNGESKREGGMNIESPHRIFVIEDATGELGNRIFKGYLLSSQVRKANYYDRHFPNNLYINDYSTIIARGPRREGEAFINLSDLYTVYESRMDLEHTNLWKGHVKQEFIDFIEAAVNDIKAGKSVGNKYWIR